MLSTRNIAPPPDWLRFGYEHTRGELADLRRRGVEAGFRLNDAFDLRMDVVERPLVLAGSAFTGRANPTGLVIDTPWKVSGPGAVAFGFGGKCGYCCRDYNTGPGANLSEKRYGHDEVWSHIACGFDPSWNYEDSANDCFKGYDWWKQSAEIMLHLLYGTGGDACGFPTNLAFWIPASFDTDVSSYSGNVRQSFLGFRDTLRSGVGSAEAALYGGAVAGNGARSDGSKFTWHPDLASSWDHGLTALNVLMHQKGYAQEYGTSADYNLFPPDGRHPIGSYFDALQALTGGSGGFGTMDDATITAKFKAVTDALARIPAIVHDEVGKFNYLPSDDALIAAGKPAVNHRTLTVVTEALKADNPEAAVLAAVTKLSAAVAALPKSSTVDLAPVMEALVTLQATVDKPTPISGEGTITFTPPPAA